MSDPTPLTVILSSREEAVYAFATDSGTGVTASEAGRVAHSVPGPRGGKTHSPDEPCSYCEKEGHRLCGKLVRLGLLKRTRPGDGSGYRYVLAAAAGSSGGTEWSQQTDDIDWGGFGDV